MTDEEAVRMKCVELAAALGGDAQHIVEEAAILAAFVYDDEPENGQGARTEPVPLKRVV